MGGRSLPFKLGGWGVHIKSVLTCAKIRAGGQPQDIPDKVPGKYKWPEGDAGVSELAVHSLSPTMGPECHRLVLKAPQPARSEYSGPEAQQTAQGEGEGEARYQPPLIPRKLPCVLLAQAVCARGPLVANNTSDFPQGAPSAPDS